MTISRLSVVRIQAAYWILRTGQTETSTKSTRELSIYQHLKKVTMVKVLTEVDMPRRMPALNVLPLEQPSKRLHLGRHPGASQLDFRFGEDPETWSAMLRCRQLVDKPVGLCSARKLRHRYRGPDGARDGDTTADATLVNFCSRLVKREARTCTSTAIRPNRWLHSAQCTLPPSRNQKREARLM